MKKIISAGLATALLVLVTVSAFGWGHGPIPGVDIPIDPGAFWDPDRPDYADDGNVYSIRQLSKGSVYDHRRQVDHNPLTMEYIQHVLNTATQIANQVTQLTSMSAEALTTHITGINRQTGAVAGVVGQAEGVMDTGKSAGQVWESTFLPEERLYSGREGLTIEERLAEQRKMSQTMNRTFLDALRIAKTNTQIDEDIQLLQDMIEQNQQVVGNKHAKQTTGQQLSFKTAQYIKTDQLLASLSAMNAVQKARQGQENADAVQQGYRFLYLGVADPYQPTAKDQELFQRQPGQGFIRF